MWFGDGSNDFRPGSTFGGKVIYSVTIDNVNSSSYLPELLKSNNFGVSYEF